MSGSNGYVTSKMSEEVKASQALEAKAEEPSVSSSGGGDAMGSALTAPSSETIDEKTYDYRTIAPTVSSGYADHYNRETGLNERLSTTQRPTNNRSQVMGSGTVSGYSQDHYVANEAPVEKEGEETPAFNDLVHVDENANLVTRIQGTVEDPNVVNSLIENNLFIDGGVYQDDIRQGSIGDCYFLAALLQIINNDPNVIRNMMSISGDQVTTTFYRREQKSHLFGIIKTTSYVPTPVTVSYGLGQVSTDGGSAWSTKGSHFRIAYDPKKSKWSANVTNNTVKVTREKLYEAAMWVHCMEQCFAVFAKNYGRYGDGSIKSNERYAGIDGGQSAFCLELFYGNDVKSAENNAVAMPEEDANPLKANKALVGDLLKFAKAQDGTAKNDIHMMAYVSTQQAVTRLQYYSEQLIQELEPQVGENEELAAALTSIRNIKDCADHYYDEADVAGREGTSGDWQQTKRDEIDAYSIELQNNAAFTALQPSGYHIFQQSVGIVVSKVTNDPTRYNNIFIYSSHAYNVSHVELVAKDGSSLNQASLSKVIKNCDINASTITLQNPHAKTKPSYNEAEDRFNEGTFDTDLAGFLGLMGYVNVAEVKNVDR